MKKRRIMALVTAAAMAMGLAGCGGGSAATATTAAPAETEKTTEAAVTEAAEAAKSEGSDNWKVAILTGTVSQGEEEFRAAERALETYGPEHIVTATYPDNFMSEMETTVSQIVSFASDPDVKAIVMCQAVPGAKAGFDKVREMGRDDMLLIAGTPQEDPAVISAASDIVLYADEAAQGDTIMEKCAEWGIDVFVHYSFPRHMAMELIVARHELLKKNAEALGIEMVDVTAPDPTAEAGLSASQQFILEDVPQQLKKYELDQVIREVVQEEKPFLGICLGLQAAVCEFAVRSGCRTALLFGIASPKARTDLFTAAAYTSAAAAALRCPAMPSLRAARQSPTLPNHPTAGASMPQTIPRSPCPTTP